MFLRSAALAALVLAPPAATAATCADLLQATRMHQETYLQMLDAVQAMQGALGAQISARALPVSVADSIRVEGLEPMAEAVVGSLARLEEATQLYQRACGS